MGLVEKTKNKIAGIGIMALGYIGLPVTIEFGRTGFHVTGVDIDSRKVKVLKKGQSYMNYILPERFAHGIVLSVSYTK